MKFCPNCGTQLPDSSKFCTKCGFKQEMVSVETSVQAPVIEVPVQRPVSAEPEKMTPVVEAPVQQPVSAEPDRMPSVAEMPVQQPISVEPEIAPPVAEPPVQQPVYSEPEETATVVATLAQQPVYAAQQEPAPVHTDAVEEPAYASELHTYGAPVLHNFSAPVRTVGQNEGTYTIPVPEEPVAAGKPGKTPKTPKAPKAPKETRAPKTAGEKKPVNKKLFLFGGIGLAAVVIAVLLIALLGGGAGADDPNLGVYTAVSCIVDGEELKAKEIKDDYIELKGKGKATVSILGDEFDAKWSLDGKDFVLTYDGDEFEGILRKGKLKISFDDMEYVFEKSEETEDEEENARDDKDGEEEKQETPFEVGCWVLLRSESEDEGLVMDEETVQLLESMGMHSFVEFYEDGSGFISVMGEETFDFTWDNGTLSANDEQLEYTFEGEELCIDFDGMVLVFVRGEKPQVEDAHPETPAETETPAQPETPTQPESSDNPYDWWGGDWYGWWAVWNGYGMLAEYTDTFWDAYAHIDVSGESGTVVLWDVDGSVTDPLAVVDVSFRQGLNPCGTMVSEGGMFMDAPVDHANWNADPGASTTRIYENMITIEGEYTNPNDPETTMEYIIILRPWGMEWEDVRNGDNSGQYYDDMMPAYYDDWYIPLVEMGADMPDSYQEGADIISGGAPATPAAPAATNALASGSWDGSTVAIVGAEAFKDADGADAVRVYYDYTNTSDETTYAASEVYYSFVQDGVELESTYAAYDKEVAEDDNDYLYVRPGVTIRCVAEYSMNPDGGPVVVSLSNYWNEAENATIELQPQNLPGRPSSPLPVVPITDPQWLAGWPTEGKCDTAYVIIDKAEIVDSYDGKKLLRVYFTYTNNGTEASSLWMDTYIYAYQDGVELANGIPATDVPEDDNYYNNVDPGKTIIVSICYEISGESPIEVEITDGWNDDGIGCIFTVE